MGLGEDGMGWDGRMSLSSGRCIPNEVVDGFIYWFEQWIIMHHIFAEVDDDECECIIGIMILCGDGMKNYLNSTEMNVEWNERT